MAWGWVDVPLRTIRLNGKKVTAAYGSVPADGATPEASEQLLYWLREQHDQRGPKFGCGVAQCGACTVLIDGAPVRSCTRQMHTVPELADVRTLDGLASGKPHSLQDAFVERQAGQCAFCINGMVMGSLGWLESRIAAGAADATGLVRVIAEGAEPSAAESWLILTDDAITVYSGKVELGTGVQTALTQIVVEELRLDVTDVRYVQGDTALSVDQGVTAGSKTLQNGGVELRQAAATAYGELSRRAAERLGVPPERLVAEDG